MDVKKILDLITQDVIDKYTNSDENFNLFLVKSFIEKKRYDEAQKQLKVSISSSDYPYVSYLYSMIISILIEDQNNFDQNKKLLIDLKPPKEILQIADDIESEQNKGGTKNGKNRLLGNNFEKKMISLINSGEVLKGWMIVGKDDKLLSKYNISGDTLKYLVDLHKFVRVKLKENSILIKKIGGVSKIVVEFSSNNIIYYNNGSSFYYFVGTADLTTKYFQINIKSEL